MTTFFDELYVRFHELHTDLLQTIDGLPQEALDWMPGNDMNSINALVAHLTGAERFLIGMVVDEAPIRDREAEFKTQGLNINELKALITGTDEIVQKVLMRIKLDDLNSKHINPRNQKTITTAWGILHALEHTAIHSGHLQITRQLWEQRST
jgi:uncharacterized damage-inducible protein DinB